MNICIGIEKSWLKNIEQTMIIKISGSETEYVSRYARHVKENMCQGYILANDKILISTQSFRYCKTVSDNPVLISEINILPMQIHSH